jgi:malate synthase
MLQVNCPPQASWLGGSGCEPIHNLMEDLATTEISRAQVWFDAIKPLLC